MNDMHQALFPLTAAQSEIWLAEMLTPGTAQYNVAEYLELHGPIDPVLFEMALRLVVAEAESLNVAFIDEGNGPRQILDPAADWPFPVIDVSSESDPMATVEAWMQADLARPVNLIGGPLFTYALFRAGPDRVFWYQRYHHILIDGVGAALIASRLADVYTALVEGREPGPTPFGPFRDLVAADAEYRTSKAFLRDQGYWMNRFADRPDPITLAGRQLSTGRIERHRTHLSPETSSALRDCARASSLTLPQLLTALTAAYLHRMTAATDLVIGVPVTARSGRALRMIPGMASNIAPLRLTIVPKMNLEEFHRHVGQELRTALRHQRYRYEDLRRDLGLGTGGQHLYATAVNVEPFDYEVRFADCVASARNLANGPARDLGIFFFDRGPSQALELGFDADAGPHSKADLAAHQVRLTRLLQAAAADPGQRIGSIDLLDPDERRTILVEWNDTARPVPQATLPELFE
ncbi:condensation domain-containing protein, partial [Inquilinus sp. 2KB_12]|uniref:condensation domain-containing protein n=1 Tax=Inquilinus sp. 2KB_12 TaxID=3232975 RepID=UPI003F9278AE